MAFFRKKRRFVVSARAYSLGPSGNSPGSPVEILHLANPFVTDGVMRPMPNRRFFRRVDASLSGGVSVRPFARPFVGP